MKGNNLTLLHQDDLIDLGCEYVNCLHKMLVINGVKGFFSIVGDAISINLVAPSGFLSYSIDLKYVGILVSSSGDELEKHLVDTFNYSVLTDKPFVFVDTSQSGVSNTLERLSHLNSYERDLYGLTDKSFSSNLYVKDLWDYINVCISLDYLYSLRPVGA